MSVRNAPAVQVANEIGDGGITRRRLLIALGVCIGAEPLLGCGRGASQVASKTSPPSSRVTNPKPLSLSNHLTLPVGTADLPFQ